MDAEWLEFSTGEYILIIRLGTAPNIGIRELARIRRFEQDQQWYFISIFGDPDAQWFGDASFTRLQAQALEGPYETLDIAKTSVVNYLNKIYNSAKLAKGQDN